MAGRLCLVLNKSSNRRQLTAATGGELQLPEPASESTHPASVSTTGSEPIVVIGEQFITPNPVKLKIQHTIFTVSENHFDITDDAGNPIFKVRDKLFSFPNRRVLFDTNGRPLVSLRQKILSVRRRWKVFRGESQKSSDCLFSVRRSSSILVRMKTRAATSLDVFLSSNTTEILPDFTIKENWHDTSCTVFHGDIPVAQMHRNHNVRSLVINADNYGIIAYPNVDYAFIVALVVILDEINRNGDC